MIFDYIKERYGVESPSLDWNNYLKSINATCLMTGYGFITYKLEGDAVIIFDMYIKPEYRGHTYAWELHNTVIDKAVKHNKRVAITFSEFKGINHMAGIKAMQVAGFSPAFKTNEEFVFIKGI